MNSKNPNIPQNINKNYIFIKRKDFCIDVLFNHEEKINIINLYMIFKSYITNKENLIFNISSITKDNNLNSEIIIFKQIKPQKIDKMTFIDFEYWYEEIYSLDKLYLNNRDFYGFRFWFNKNSINWENLYIYPKYPWEKNFKNIYFKKEEYILKLEKENKIMKNKIKYLKRFFFLKNKKTQPI